MDVQYTWTNFASYTSMTQAQKNKVHEALNLALNNTRGLLPKRTGLLQSQFAYRISGNDCIIYINDKCWYAKYLVENGTLDWDEVVRVFKLEYKKAIAGNLGLNPSKLISASFDFSSLLKKV